MEPDESDELLSAAELDRIERRVLNADSADPEVGPNTPDRRRVSNNHVLALVRGVRDLKRSRDVHRALLVRALRALRECDGAAGDEAVGKLCPVCGSGACNPDDCELRAVLAHPRAVALLKEADRG